MKADRELEALLSNQQAEQASAAFDNIAKLLGRYYQQLLEAGIPDELAAVLVRDAHTKMALGGQGGNA